MGRCVGFEKENTFGMRHGANRSDAVLAADPRTVEIVEQLERDAPVCTAADRMVLRLLGITLRRIELANAAIELADAEATRPLSAYLVDVAPALASLRADLRAWINLARKLASDLGMTPASRLRMGLDVALTRKALNVVEMHALAAAEDEEAG